MKVVRAPLRVSLFGGGTDLEPYCSKYGSTIISFAINRYIYLIWNPRPTGGCHLGYSKVEELESLRDAEHTLVREAARRFEIEEPCTLTIVSDLPKGTGLGSSSALAVCLAYLGLEHTIMGEYAVEAWDLERLHSNAGCQDHLPATFGGLHIYHIAIGDLELPWNRYSRVCRSGGVEIGAERVPYYLLDLINDHGLLLYTGHSRPADSVLPSWTKSEEQLHQIKALADKVTDGYANLTPERLGNYLNQTWELKRSISGVTDPVLNRQYALAMLNGALGGKLCGAGAGGCWFFLVPPDRREQVVQALGLTEIPFQIAEKGVQMWEL